MLKCCLLLWRLAGYNQENPELDIFKFWLIQFVIAFSVMLFITASRLSIGRALKTEEALSILSAMYPRWLTQCLVWENKPEFKSLFGNVEQELWTFYSVHVPTATINSNQYLWWGNLLHLPEPQAPPLWNRNNSYLNKLTWHTVAKITSSGPSFIHSTNMHKF